MDNQELLQALRAIVKEEISPIQQDLNGMKTDIDGMKTDIATMKEDIETLKEDSTITRNGVNTLLDWAEQAQVEVKIPLYKKAE